MSNYRWSNFRLTSSIIPVFASKAEYERNQQYKEANETCLPLLKAWWVLHPDKANYIVSEQLRYTMTLHTSVTEEWLLDRVDGIRRDNVNFLFFASQLGDKYWRHATPQLAEPDNSTVCRHLFNQCLSPYQDRIHKLVYETDR